MVEYFTQPTNYIIISQKKTLKCAFLYGKENGVFMSDSCENNKRACSMWHRDLDPLMRKATRYVGFNHDNVKKVTQE